MSGFRIERLADPRGGPAGPTWDYFRHFASHATRATQPFLLEGVGPGDQRAVCPVVRLHKRLSTDALRSSLRPWVGWLGQVSRKTTYLVDTALLSYAYRDPIWAPTDDPGPLCGAIIEHLQQLPDADAIWYAQPSILDGSPESPRSAAGGAGTDLPWKKWGFFSFEMLPTARVTWRVGDDWGRFLAGQSKKRRRNVKHDAECFAAGGGRLELLSSPFPEPVLDAMQASLRQSAQQSPIDVPYNDVLLGPGFRTQSQIAWCAWVGSRFAGFMSFIRDGEALLQCHGGFDYQVSLAVRAYPRLMDEAIRYAIEAGCDSLWLGPLNNEAKRRVATDLLPMRVHLWNRRAVDTYVVRRWFARNFQVYVGP